MDENKINFVKLKRKKKFITKESVEKQLGGIIESEKTRKEMSDKLFFSQFIYNDFDINKLEELKENLNIIKSSYTIPKKEKYKTLENISRKVEVFQPLVNSIKNHLSKNQTGDKLIKNAQEININYSKNLNKISSSVQSILDSYKEFQDASEYVYFDTETFGGINEYGIKELLGIQEFSLKKVKKDGTTIREVESLVGLDKSKSWDYKRIDKISSWIDEYERTGAMPKEGMAQVTLNRLAKLGHEKTKIKYVNGLANIEQFPSNADMPKFLDPKMIRDGFERMLKVGEKQNKELIGAEVLGEGNGIPAYIDSFFDMMNELNNNFAVGKNINNFDNNVLSVTAEDFVKRLNNTQINYMRDKYGVDFNTLKYNKGHLDQENVIRTAFASKGISRYFTNQQLEELNNLNITNGQLEAFGQTYFPEIYKAAGAHTAKIDNLVGINLMSKPLYSKDKTLIGTMIDDIKENASSINLKFNNNGFTTKEGKTLTPVFTATKSDIFEANPFDFQFKSMDGELHFNVKEVLDSNGKARSSKNAPGTKKNASYIIKTYEFNPTEDMKKAMKSVSDYYAGDEPYYILEYTPELDKYSLGGNESLRDPLYRIVRSQEEINASISNGFIHSLNKESDGNYISLREEDGFSKEYIQEVQDLLSFKVIKGNSVNVTPTTPKEVIVKGTHALRNDPSSRTVRNYETKKAKAYKNVKNYFKLNGVDDPKKMRDYLAQITSANLSAEVAAGNDLTLEVIKNNVKDIVGYEVAGETVLHPGTYDRFLDTWNYYSSFDNTLERVLSLSKNDNKDIENNNYESYMRQLRYDVADLIDKDKDIKEEFVKHANLKNLYIKSDEIVDGVVPLKMFNFDSNYFEFDMGNFFKTDDNVFKINLNQGKQYEFVNNLLKRRLGENIFKNLSSNEKDALGKKELLGFINEVQSSSTYNGIFENTLNDIVDGDGIVRTNNVKMSSANLGEKLLNDLRRYRKENPTAGYEKAVRIEDVLTNDVLISFAEKISNERGVDLITPSLEKTTSILRKQSNKVIGKNKEEVNNIAKQIVENISMGDFKKITPRGIVDLEEIVNFATETYGYNKDIFASDLTKTYNDQLDIITNVIKPIMQNGGKILFDDKNIGFKFEDSDIVNITNLLPISMFSNGALINKIGEVNTSSGLMLNIEDAIENEVLNMSKVGFDTTLLKGKRGLKGLSSSLQTASQQRESLTDTVLYSLKKMGKSLRENPQVSAGISQQEVLNSIYNVNFEEIQKAIPHVKDIILKSDKFSAKYKNAISKYGTSSFSSEFPQASPDEIQNLMKILLDVSGEFNTEIEDQNISSQINTYLREVLQVDYIYRAGGRELAAFQQASNYRRPPIHQSKNAKIYEKRKIENLLNEQSKENDALKYVFTNRKIVTQSEKKLTERSFEHVGETTSTFTAVRANISDSSFHRLLSDKYMEYKERGELTEELEEAFKVASTFNLAEQQKIIDGRLANIVFDEADTQYINTNKDLVSVIIQKEKDLLLNEEMLKKQTSIIDTIPIIKLNTDGTITFKYGNKTYVRDGQRVVEEEGYGGIRKAITSKHDGTLNFRYFSKSSNLEVSEDEINNIIKNKNLKTEEEIFNYLGMELNPKFKIVDATHKGFNKLYVDNEKGVAVSTAIGAGKTNKNIAGVLRDSGFGDKYNTLITDDFIDTALSGKTKVLSNYGFKDLGSFKQAVKKERNIIADQILNKIPGLEDVSIFTNDNLAKHESVDMSLKDMLYSAAYKKVEEQKGKGLIRTREETERALNRNLKTVYEKARESKAIGAFIKEDGFIDETGQILTQSVDATENRLAYNDIVDLAKEIGIYDEEYGIGIPIFNKDGERIGSKLLNSNSVANSATEFAGKSKSDGRLREIDGQIKYLEEIKNSDEGLNRLEKQEYRNLTDARDRLIQSHKMMSIDDRGMTSLMTPSYSSSEKGVKLKNLLSGVEDEEGKNLYEKYFNDTYDENGQILDDAVKRQNKALIGDLEKKKYYNEDLEYLGGKYKKLTEDYIKDADFDSPRQRIYDTFKNDSKINEISIEKAELGYSSRRGREAIAWNSGKINKANESSMAEKGFETIKIDDLLMPNIDNSASLLGLENTPYGKSFLLDTGEEKIAVPYTPALTVGDELINTKRDQALRRIVNSNKRINSIRNGEIETDKPIDYYIAKQDAAVKELKDTIIENQNIVDKSIDRVQLDSYHYSKSNMMLYNKVNKNMVDGIDVGNNVFYSTAKFNGSTLGELADRGIYLPAVGLSEQHYRNEGYFKKEKLDELGMTEDEMRKYLSENPTITLERRSPDTEGLSTTPVLAYLDPQSTSDKITKTAELSLSQNADVDGDSGSSAFVKINGKDFSMHRLMKEKKGVVDEKAEDVFHEYEKSILANSAIMGRIRETLIDDPEKGLIAKEERMAKTTLREILENKNNFILMNDSDIDPSQARRYVKLNDEILSKATEKYGELNLTDLDDNLINALDDTVSSSYQGETLTEAKKAVNYVLSDIKQKMANISNTAKQDIGYMDTPMTRLEQTALGIGYEGNDFNILKDISKVFKESPISKKHDSSDKISITTEVRNAVTGAMNGSEKETENLKELISLNMKGILEEARSKYELYSLSADDNEASEEVLGVINKITSQARESQTVRNIFNSTGKINTHNILAHEIVAMDGPMGEAYANISGREIVNAKEILENTVKMDGYEKTSSKITRKALAEGVENFAHGFSNSGLGMAALGIAAAVMVTGYIGGNPTAPADNQAEGIGNEGYDSLQDKDLSIQSMPQGAGQGYVININAESEKGKEHVQEAIQKAVYSSFPTDINISMNIQDKARNIDSRYVEELINRAL